MTDLGKTPWVDRTANAVWSRIVAAAPKPSWVPEHTTKRGGKVTVKEYGCGHYGCVMPTGDPEVVCKITSDVTEAVFVAAALSLGFGEETEGIVRYHAVYELVRPESSAARKYRESAAKLEAQGFHEAAKAHRQMAEATLEHFGRKTFVLWRESATEVGLRHRGYSGGTTSYEYRRIENLRRYLGLFKYLAGAARDSLKHSDDPFVLLAEAKRLEDWAWDHVSNRDVEVDGERMFAYLTGARRVAVALRACDVVAELMQNTDGCDLIGSALRYYLGEGLLLADVHANNVGKVERTSGWVITDPGHAVPLEERWRTVTVKDLP